MFGEKHDIFTAMVILVIITIVGTTVFFGFLLMTVISYLLHIEFSWKIAIILGFLFSVFIGAISERD